MMRRVVVLPQPEGPRSEKNSPLRTSRSTWSTATTSPNVLVTFTRRTWISASEPASSCRAAILAERADSDVGGALILLGVAAVHDRHGHRHAPSRARRPR